jgi:hypothetical protein
MVTDSPPEDQPPGNTAGAPTGKAKAGGYATPQPDDPLPHPDLVEVVESAAQAEALKAVSGALEDVLSSAPDKRDARNKLVADYGKAAGERPLGDLRRKYEDANTRFLNAATDMLRKAAGEQSRLELWIQRYLTTDDNSLRGLLLGYKQLRDRLAARSGPREAARDAAAAKAKAWQQAFAAWTAPHGQMGALIDSYGPKIDKLNAQINNNVDADLAIYSFWFEVAPSHLQLRAETVTGANAPGADLLSAALAGFDDELNGLKAGSERGDGSLFLILPEGLAGKREKVASKWREAAIAQGQAEAAYKLRPDSAAALKARADTLQQNRAADAKALLSKPTTD